MPRGMSKQQKLTEEMKEKTWKLYLGGVNKKDISFKLGIADTTVNKYLKY